MDNQFERLQEKIVDSYPRTFSKQLKENGGNLYPLKKFAGQPLTLTDEEIRKQIEMKTFGFQYSVDIVKKFLEGVKEQSEINNYIKEHPEKAKFIYHILPYMTISDKILYLKPEKPLRVINLGCGFGIESLIIGELEKDIKDIKIYSLDADPEKVSLFDSILKEYKFDDGKKGHDKITPIVGDIFDLPDFDTPFDGVFIKHVVGYLASLNSTKYQHGSIVDIAQKTMRDTTKKVMKQVKKIAPNGWLTLVDRDTNSYTRDAFVDSVVEVLGFSGQSKEYEMQPVQMNVAGQIMDGNVLVINRRINGAPYSYGPEESLLDRHYTNRNLFDD